MKQKLLAEDGLWKGFPFEVKSYIAYSRSLDFDETPDYAKMIELFNSCLIRNKLNVDSPEFPWVPRNLNTRRSAFNLTKKSIQPIEPLTFPKRTNEFHSKRSDCTQATDKDSVHTSLLY